jgi:hypothetical protein
MPDIQKVASVDGNFVGSDQFSQTVALTVVDGFYRRLMVGVNKNGGDTVIAITYNDKSFFANLVEKLADDSGAFNYLFWLDDPAVGTHNIVVTASAPNNQSLMAVQYVNVKPGAPSVHGSAKAVGASVTVALIPPSNKNWISAFGINHGTGTLVGTNAIANNYNDPNTFQFMGDTGVISPAASTTVGVTGSGGTASQVAIIAASLEPADAAIMSGVRMGRSRRQRAGWSVSSPGGFF